MFLGMYSEYGANNGISMKDDFDRAPFYGKERIVNYLKTCGKSVMVRTKLAVDRLTGDRIKGLSSIELMTDGKYDWYSDLAYYVDKYNLRLPEEFENYVLNNPNQL